MTTEHLITPDGESTEQWAWRQPGFIGSVRQLCCCARCGETPPAKPHHEPRHYGRAPVLHLLCDQCFDALPD